MMNYAQGGQPHGLKSLAQDLRSYGRDGDTILAHINPQEAGILKALGGSGTINPDTGLPEYGFFKSVGNIVAAPFRAANQVVKAIPVIGPAIDRGLVSLDKAVGNTIPGGWNTLAQTALAFTPLGLPAKVGLAALGGSGAFGKEGKFNFQKALLSGAMAYGMNQLTQGLEDAGGGASSTSNALTAPPTSVPTDPFLGSVPTDLSANISGYDVGAPLGAPQSIGSEIMRGNIGNVAERGVASVRDTLGSMSMPSDFMAKTGEKLTAAGEGIKNLSGFGTGAEAALDKFTGPITNRGMISLGVGTLGTMSLDEQEKAINEQRAAGAVNDAEYNRQMAIIADGRRRAEEAMKANPYQFAMGGQVDDEMGGDYYAMGMDQGNLQKGLFGMGYAEGGTPRFLSGGGDGMSDSIPATINDKQPARLADGEFVIPADVVSHLGNGSSKAGAKRLYSMMGKVRQARTGKKQQAPEVNTKRLMLA
jgi:hypothetical protein